MVTDWPMVMDKDGTINADMLMDGDWLTYFCLEMLSCLKINYLGL